MSILIRGVVTLIVLYCLGSANSKVDIDENGYILYCPCMGRFGNQAEHFLGTLSFAKQLNRTLVLPAWVEYKPSSIKSIQVPFDTYFKVESLAQYHRVMTMETFMAELAPTVWPVGKRTVYCYRPRQALMSKGDNGCNAKDGNPFESFWDTYGVNFDKSEYYEPLMFDVSVSSVLRDWTTKYSSNRHPVLAFTGAPAPFPMRQADADLHRYLLWSDHMEQLVQKFLTDNIPEGRPFLAIHLRIGEDWVNVCKHVDDLAVNRHHLFASSQCLGHNFEHAPRLTIEAAKELCLPPRDLILKQLKALVERVSVKYVVVATDSSPAFIDEIRKHLNTDSTLGEVKVMRYEPVHTHADLALLGRADFFIGSCTSTFSGFAVRERRFRGLPVDFWASHHLSAGIDEL